jgi:hypothetical protein
MLTSEQNKFLKTYLMRIALPSLMMETDNVKNVWEYPAFRVRYYDAVRPPARTFRRPIL